MKFGVHESAIMDRFSATIEDDSIRTDIDNGIRGAGPFRTFKNLLQRYHLWEPWNRFKQAELRDMADMAVEWCERKGVAYLE